MRTTLLASALAVLSAVPGGGLLAAVPGGGMLGAVPDGASAATGPDSARAIRRGRRLAGWLMDGRADTLSALVAPEYRRRLGGAEGVRALAGKVDRQLGTERGVVREAAYTRRTAVHYYRISRFSKAPGRTITTHFAWRRDGAVVLVGVHVTPRPARTGHEDYRTRTVLDLPFRGRWYVAWGGRRPEQNYHVRARGQRFAYDFLKLEDGRSHEGDGSSNEDYYCFGEPVLAPAAGRVTEAVDSVHENTPGEMNREAIFGNHVVIAHAGGEYSVLAHLRHGSVAVEAGDSVERGQRIGECGNTGHSSEPHLHYQLQDGPELGRASGLPAPFADYEADGEHVERAEPTRGQLVRPVGAEGSDGEGS